MDTYTVKILKFELSGFENPLQLNIETGIFMFGSTVTLLCTLPIFLLCLSFYSPFICALFIILGFNTLKTSTLSFSERIMGKGKEKEKGYDNEGENDEGDEEYEGEGDEGEGSEEESVERDGLEDGEIPC